MGRASIAAALLAALAGCAQLGANRTLNEGLRQYDAGDHATSATNLRTALDQGLRGRDQANAHKHLAFIHCSANRERQCREEFRKALAAEPALRLSAAEAGHPVWGPIFLSLSGGAALSAGLKQYESGDYAESAKNLQGAISLGLPEKERANAHKHLGFIYCSWNQERQCRDEFRKALAADSGLQLSAAEAGHPVWGPMFQSVKSGR